MDVDSIGADAGLTGSSKFARKSTCFLYQIDKCGQSNNGNSPSTAAPISASSNTMNGALPPASIDILTYFQVNRAYAAETIDGTHFFIVPAAYLYSIFATGVLPVNDTFLTIGFSQSSRPTSAMFPCVVTTFMTPGGIPARFANYSKTS